MEPLPGIDGAFLAFETGEHPAPRRLGTRPRTLRRVGARCSHPPPATPRSAGRRTAASSGSPAPPAGRAGAARDSHHPVWVDDPEFELDDHLRRASLPAPGGSRRARRPRRRRDGPATRTRPPAVGDGGGRRAGRRPSRPSSPSCTIASSTGCPAPRCWPPSSTSARRGRPLRCRRSSWDPPPLPTQPALLKYAHRVARPPTRRSRSGVPIGGRCPGRGGEQNRRLARGRGASRPRPLLRAPHVDQRAHLVASAVRHHVDAHSKTSSSSAGRSARPSTT